MNRQLHNRRIVGTVGELQFEVIQYRLLHEYGASCEFRHLSMHKACWVTTSNEAKLEEFKKYKYSSLAYDKDDNLVFLAESPYMLNVAMGDYEDLTFHTTSEFKTAITSAY